MAVCFVTWLNRRGPLQFSLRAPFGWLFEKLLSDGLTIGSARPPLCPTSTEEFWNCPHTRNKPEFGPCAPVVATLLTDWGLEWLIDCA